MENRLFSFKQKSQDFIVKEELPFTLSGEGDVFFVYFEKRNLNTMDVVNHLCSVCNLSRLTLWIAGLKDKKAITRQRICIYKSALKKLGGENIFLEKLSEVATVLKTDRHTDPIGMTVPIKNTFFIRLRANKKLSQKERETANNKILSLFEKGFPNLYWSQRFGINGINPKQGSEILQWKWRLRNDLKSSNMAKDKKEIVFKIQAYASKIYNEYIYSRTKKWLWIFDWDILEIVNKKDYKRNKLWIYQAKTNTVKLFENTKDQEFFRYPNNFQEEIPFNENTMMPTWPVVGYNLLIAPKDTVAGNKEKSFLETNAISAESLKLCMQYRIFGIRRPLRVFPEKVSVQFQEDDIILNFTLPSWSYASIMINEIEKTVGVNVYS